MSRPLPVSLLFCCIMAQGAYASGGARAWLSNQGYAPPTGSLIIACHGYGCVHRTPVAIDSTWFADATILLARNRGSPHSEREALRRIVQAYTGTLARAFRAPRDQPRSPPLLSGRPGQMDCLDTTANVTSLLLTLDERRLLAHHTVEPPKSRGIFLDGRYPHFTAVIGERRSGERWAVDPWARAPGQEIDIRPLRQWQRET
jgi:hypothetical protein